MFCHRLKEANLTLLTTWLSMKDIFGRSQRKPVLRLEHRELLGAEVWHDQCHRLMCTYRAISDLLESNVQSLTAPYKEPQDVPKHLKRALSSERPVRPQQEAEERPEHQNTMGERHAQN